MKKLSMILMVAGILMAGACKKKDEKPQTPAPNTPPAPVMNGSMTAKLNGAAWTSTRNTAVLAVDTDNDLSALVINGETSGDVIVLGIDFPTANTTMTTGNHDMDDAGLIMYTKKTQGGGTTTEHFPFEGTVNITSVDNANKKISGTFNCSLYKPGSQASGDSLFITDGVFTNLTYLVQQ